MKLTSDLLKMMSRDRIFSQFYWIESALFAIANLRIFAPMDSGNPISNETEKKWQIYLNCRGSLTVKDKRILDQIRTCFSDYENYYN